MFYPELANNWEASGAPLTVTSFKDLTKYIKLNVTTTDIQTLLRKNNIVVPISEQHKLTRRQTAILIQELLHLFEREVDFNGQLVSN